MGNSACKSDQPRHTGFNSLAAGISGETCKRVRAGTSFVVAIRIVVGIVNLKNLLNEALLVLDIGERFELINSGDGCPAPSGVTIVTRPA